MRPCPTRAVAGLVALGVVAACAPDGEIVTIRTGTTEAEAACTAAVNRARGDNASYVILSDHGATQSDVTLRAADGSEWRCTATNDGTVTALGQG